MRKKDITSKEALTEQLSSILPNRQYGSAVNGMSKEQATEEAVTTVKAKQTAKELAALKYKEKQAIKQLEQSEKAKQALAEETGMSISEMPTILTESKANALRKRKQNLDTIVAIESQVAESAPGANALDVAQLAETTPASKYPEMVNKALQLQGASRPEMAKLLSSLNINLSVRLSKTDTANLLACLLTCNDSQLNALMSNKKLPVAIKAVIKRIQEDAKLGNIETIEKLWDRIFGKNAMQLDLPDQSQVQTGIIPNTPVSREAYVIIRETLLK